MSTWDSSADYQILCGNFVKLLLISEVLYIHRHLAFCSNYGPPILFTAYLMCEWDIFFRRSYTVHRVPHTNLMLLAVDAQCYCILDEPVTVEPREVRHILSRRSIVTVALNEFRCVKFQTHDAISTTFNWGWWQSSLFASTFFSLSLLEMLFYLYWQSGDFYQLI